MGYESEYRKITFKMHTAPHPLSFHFEEAFRTSCELAKQRGAYANWKGIVHDKNGTYIRNATLTAVTPTDTV